MLKTISPPVTLPIRLHDHTTTDLVSDAVESFWRKKHSQKIKSTSMTRNQTTFPSKSTFCNILLGCIPWRNNFKSIININLFSRHWIKVKLWWMLIHSSGRVTLLVKVFFCWTWIKTSSFLNQSLNFQNI